jgi:thioredoxin 1
MVMSVTDTVFDSEVLASPTPVLVEFGASWCPPCRMIEPVLEAVAEERGEGLRVVTVDVDTNPTLQARYGALSVPTLLLFVEGRPVLHMVGYRPKGALLRAVDEALAVPRA